MGEFKQYKGVKFVPTDHFEVFRYCPFCGEKTETVRIHLGLVPDWEYQECPECRWQFRWSGVGVDIRPFGKRGTYCGRW